MDESCVLTKQCSTCAVVKPLEQFYKNGRQGQCKMCQQAQHKQYMATRVIVYDHTITQKQCSSCQQEKPIEAFDLNKDAQNGRRAMCKVCRTARRRDLGTDSLYAKAYRQEHREELITRLSHYRQTHAEELLQYNRNYYEEHTEERRQSRRDYGRKHRDEERAYAQHRYAIAPHLYIAQAQRRRALKRGATINDFTAAQWREVQAAYDHRCVYCGKRFKGKLTQDHITPLSKGGNHTASNIVPACTSCNSRKCAGPVPLPIQPLLLTVT